MYSLKNYKPFAEVVKRQDELLKKIELVKDALAAGQERLTGLEAEAAQMLAAGEEGYIKKMDEVNARQSDNAAIGKELEILQSALELVKKELAAKEREAKNQMTVKARADHEKIAIKGITAVKELLAALAEEERLAQAVQRPLGGAGFLVLLASAFQCHESDLRRYRERISDKGYSKGVK